MANGIYTTVNSREELAEMDENRDKMHQIKIWFEKAAIIEAVSMIYLTITSSLSVLAAVPGIIYLAFIKKKDAGICKIVTLLHMLLALLVIVTSVTFCISALTSDAPSVSLLPKGLSNIVPEDVAADSDGNRYMVNVIFDSVKIITIVNLIISAFMSLLPIWISVKSINYCTTHDKLKEKPGYPYFHPDINVSQNRFATSDMNSLTGFAQKLNKALTPEKNSENSQAMKALVEEAEKLKIQKQMQSERTNTPHEKSDIDFMPEIDVLPVITDSEDLKKLPPDNSFMEDIKIS
ncbi:MAG: hypothetical protein E7510_00050 [Ruminococcus sp.]|nr:hypothetical protein [Ruminococcus sp.]